MDRTERTGLFLVAAALRLAGRLRRGASSLAAIALAPLRAAEAAEMRVTRAELAIAASACLALGAFGRGLGHRRRYRHAVGTDHGVAVERHAIDLRLIGEGRIVGEIAHPRRIGDRRRALARWLLVAALARRRLALCLRRPPIILATVVMAPLIVTAIVLATVILPAIVVAALVLSAVVIATGAALTATVTLLPVVVAAIVVAALIAALLPAAIATALALAFHRAALALGHALLAAAAAFLVPHAVEAGAHEAALGGDDAEIVLGVLVVRLGQNTVARRRRLARQRHVLLVDLVRRTPDANVRAIAVIGLVTAGKLLLSAAIVAATLPPLIIRSHSACRWSAATGIDPG